jgi:hypothetical protein
LTAENKLYHFHFEIALFPPGKDARLYGRQGCLPLHFARPLFFANGAIPDWKRY